jgi:hypothetical protein
VWDSDFDGSIAPSSRLAKRLDEARTSREAIEALVGAYNKEMDNVGSGRWFAGFVPPSLKVCPESKAPNPTIVVRRAGQATCARPLAPASRGSVASVAAKTGNESKAVNVPSLAKTYGPQAYGASLGQNMSEAVLAMSNAMPGWRQALAQSAGSVERKCSGGRALAFDFFTNSSPVSYVRIYCADQKLFAVSVNESTKESFESMRAGLESVRGASSDAWVGCQSKLSVHGVRGMSWTLDASGAQYSVQWIPRADSGIEAGVFSTLCRNE